MSDLIKRSDAIKAVRKSKWWHFCDLIPVLSAIKDIPTADRPKGDYNRGYCDAVQGIADEMVKQGKYIVQDRPQGEWIRTENHTIKCCECGAEFTDDIMDACLTSRVPFPRACPICMARMKGADNE